jgi:hypothetical protein
VESCWSNPTEQKKQPDEKWLPILGWNRAQTRSCADIFSFHFLSILRISFFGFDTIVTFPFRDQPAQKNIDPVLFAISWPGLVRMTVTEKSRHFLVAVLHALGRRRPLFLTAPAVVGTMARTVPTF